MQLSETSEIARILELGRTAITAKTGQRSKLVLKAKIIMTRQSFADADGGDVGGNCLDDVATKTSERGTDHAEDVYNADHANVASTKATANQKEAAYFNAERTESIGS